jgi:hypothetical protein
MYVAAAYYAAFWYTGAKKRWTRGTFLTLTAAFMFMAYGAKMVYLYYAPGLALVVWLGDSRPRSSDLGQAEGEPKPRRWYQRVWRFLVKKRLVVPAALALLVVGFILVESVFLSAKTGAVTSHFSILSGSHGGLGGKGPRIHAAEDFFALYTRAPADWVQALSVGAAAMIGVLAYGKSKLARLYALSLLIFALLQTFVVRRLNPLTPWAEPHPRYLIAMAVPLAILIAVFAVSAATKVLTSKGDRSQKLWVRGLRGTARIGVIFGLLYVFQHDLPERWDKEWGKRDNWHRTEELAFDLSRAFEEGLAIVSSSHQGKPAWAAGAVYVEPKLLLANGRLLPHQGFTRKFNRGKYMARAVAIPKMKKKRLDAWVKHQVSRRDCVVVMRQSSRFMSVRKHLRDKCEPLEDAVKERPPSRQK